MDKLKSVFRRKSKAEPGSSATAGTKTETPSQAGTATQTPKPTPTDTAAAPSSSEPVAPAGETRAARGLTSTEEPGTDSGSQVKPPSTPSQALTNQPILPQALLQILAMQQRVKLRPLPLPNSSHPSFLRPTA